MAQPEHSRLSECSTAELGGRIHYRIKRPTIVLAYKDNHQVAVTLPVGKMMDVVSRAEDDRFLVVDVDGERFQVFETDLVERCSAHAKQGPTSDKPAR